MNIIDILFNDINTFLRSVLIVLIILLIVQRVNQAVNLIKEARSKEEYIQDLKLGVLGKKDLHNYTPREFEHWCAEFIERQGFTDIKVAEAGPDGGKDIICRKGTETYYIECKRYSYSKNSASKVDLEIARKLVGAMEGDGVRNGFIITSGYATNEAVEYLNTLPKGYKVEVIDGDELINRYTSIKHLIYVPEKS
jgi:HJR/Mrr/RecB family endonuclease